jgi:hypothetical protein
MLFFYFTQSFAFLLAFRSFAISASLPPGRRNQGSHHDPHQYRHPCVGRDLYTSVIHPAIQWLQEHMLIENYVAGKATFNSQK